MSRADFAFRPARDRRRVGLGCAALAVLSILVVRSATGFLVACGFAVVALACLRPRCSTRGDTFVMRGLVRTRRFPKAEIQRFLVRDGLLGLQYVEVVTRAGDHLRVPGTDRPVPRHRGEHRPDDRAGAEAVGTPADAVCNRLHLWHMVSTI